MEAIKNGCYKYYDSEMFDEVANGDEVHEYSFTVTRHPKLGFI